MERENTLVVHMILSTSGIARPGKWFISKQIISSLLHSLTASRLWRHVFDVITWVWKTVARRTLTSSLKFLVADCDTTSHNGGTSGKEQSTAVRLDISSWRLASFRSSRQGRRSTLLCRSGVYLHVCFVLSCFPQTSFVSRDQDRLFVMLR